MIFIDHLAFRVKEGNKDKAVKFFQDAFSYKVQENFLIYFDDEKKDVASCTALEPGDANISLPWTTMVPFGKEELEYVRPPEIFISEGGSVVSEWVKNKGAGLHHIALRCPSTTTVKAEMEKWLKNGWTEGFSSDVLHCDGLFQVFSKPTDILGVVFELIQRKEHGFCKDSVKQLMLSSKGD